MSRSDTAKPNLNFSHFYNSISNQSPSLRHLQAITDHHDSRIYQALQFMRANLSASLSISQIANSVKLSSSHLRRLFKTETGMSVAHWNKQLNLEKAAELFAVELFSVKEVMRALGVNDASHYRCRTSSLVLTIQVSIQ